MRGETLSAHQLARLRKVYGEPSPAAQLSRQRSHLGALKALRAAQWDARRLRFAVSGSTTIIGACLFIIGFFGGWLRFYEMLPSAFGSAGWYWSLGVCFIIIQLAVLPTDERLINALCYYFVCFDLFCVTLAIMGGVLTRERYAACPSLTCYAWSGGFISASLCLFPMYFHVLPTLFNMKMMSPRQKLQRLWANTRVFYVWAGTCLTTAMALITYHDPVFRSSPDCVAYLFCFSSWIVLGAAMSPHVRGRVTSALHRLATAGESDAAACVAALVGNRSAPEALSFGQSTFRALPFDKLSAAALRSSSLAEQRSSPAGPPLHEATAPSELGAVDAFLSHSWSDDGVAKWEVLSAWAADFERREGRTPSCWLDKACINQQAIQESLAALPVYLSGCRQMVVLLGETYFSRLWCCMEIYTFLQMGGSVDRIEILPVALSSAEVHLRIDAFDAARCQCYLEEDKQRLLAVIESGFGDCQRFSELVKASLTKAFATAPLRIYSPTAREGSCSWSLSHSLSMSLSQSLRGGSTGGSSFHNESLV